MNVKHIFGREDGCLSLGTLALQQGWQPQNSSLRKGPEFREEEGHAGTKECFGVLEKGILRRRKSRRDPGLCSWSLLCWFMDANHYLTWCEPAAGSLSSLYQDKEGKESLPA